MAYKNYFAEFEKYKKSLEGSERIVGISKSLATDCNAALSTIKSTYIAKIENCPWEEIGKRVVVSNILKPLANMIAETVNFIESNLVPACTMAINNLLLVVLNIEKGDLALQQLYKDLKALEAELSVTPQFIYENDWETLPNRKKVWVTKKYANSHYTNLVTKITNIRQDILQLEATLDGWCTQARNIISQINGLGTLNSNVRNNPSTSASLTPLTFVDYSKDGEYYITYAINYDELKERLGNNVFSELMIAILKGEVNNGDIKNRYFDTLTNGTRRNINNDKTNKEKGISIDKPQFLNPFFYGALTNNEIEGVIGKLLELTGNGYTDEEIAKKLASYGSEAKAKLGEQAKKAIGITLDQLTKDSYKYSESVFPNLTESQRFSLDRAISDGVLADNPIVRLSYGSNASGDELSIYTGSLEDSFLLNEKGFQFTCHRFTAYGTGQAAVRRIERMGYTQEEQDAIFTEENNDTFGLKSNMFGSNELINNFGKLVNENNVSVGMVLLQDGHEVLHGGTVDVNEGKLFSRIEAVGGGTQLVQNTLSDNLEYVKALDDDKLWEARFNSYLEDHPPANPTDLYYEFYPPSE